MQPPATQVPLPVKLVQGDLSGGRAIFGQGSADPSSSTSWQFGDATSDVVAGHIGGGTSALVLPPLPPWEEDQDMSMIDFWPGAADGLHLVLPMVRREDSDEQTVGQWPFAVPVQPPLFEQYGQVRDLAAAARGMPPMPQMARPWRDPVLAQHMATARRRMLESLAGEAAADTELFYDPLTDMFEHELMPGGGLQRRRRRRRGAKGCLGLVSKFSTAKALAAPAGDLCTICLEEMLVGEKVRKFCCSHMLHEECSKRYYGRGGVKPICPVCRADICQQAPGHV